MFFFSRLRYLIQVAWYYWCSLMILDYIFFLACRRIRWVLIQINDLFGVLLESSLHNVIFLKADMLDHGFQMKLLRGDIFLAFHFLFDFSFSYFVIKASNDFRFHVLLFFFSSQTSPVKFSIFSKELLTFLYFWEIHWDIIAWMTLYFLLIFFLIDL